ncbi:MAG: DUF2309 domain-containing protein [Bacteroidia bacterium]|nr:DUF2309 domain-containing protein [Bacteroidia bacterium]
MESDSPVFDEHAVLHRLEHYLPAQAALKDFVHHNTLHAFQNEPFHAALNRASHLFGMTTYLSLDEFRDFHQSGKISSPILDRVIEEHLTRREKLEGNELIERISYLKNALLHTQYPDKVSSRLGNLRSNWKRVGGINLDKMVHPFLFRLLAAYLDQGIAAWKFPVNEAGFLASLRDLEQNGWVSLFKTPRARALLLEEDISLEKLLKLVVGREELYEEYLFDQQFLHPGWSGFVAVVQNQPETLLDRRLISLKEMICLELLLELDALDHKLEKGWVPLGESINYQPQNLFAPGPDTELQLVLSLWQEAFEWSYFDQVLKGIGDVKHLPKQGSTSFQGLFCIDDREYSLRRHLEKADPSCETFGTPGYFGVEFYFQPEAGKFVTKACPAPMNPAFLIKEGGRKATPGTDLHFTRHSHHLLRGWLISQTLGFWAGLKLFLNIFKPSISPATAYSFAHMDSHSRLSITSEGQVEGGLKVGFTFEEMALRVKNTLKSVGLSTNFAPLIYIVGHGGSSVNNTYYAGYDCGACGGRPGGVNARVFARMANKPEVRQILAREGFQIPPETLFLGALHDTTRDEIEFYDEERIPAGLLEQHKINRQNFQKALVENARERSLRFSTLNHDLSLIRLHQEVKKRSVSLFEPRPEWNHTANALCIVGRKSLYDHLFLDKRPFLNSYDYTQDPDGAYLLSILSAVVPVCGGINLEYYFSRVDQEKLGAGTKLPHNVVGLFAVSNGVEGDLRPGLPSQMIEIHDPVRLLFIIEHQPAVVLKVIQSSPGLYEWIRNEWVLMTVKNPVSGEIFRFQDGNFVPYQPLQESLEQVEDVEARIRQNPENIPVFQTS